MKEKTVDTEVKGLQLVRVDEDKNTATCGITSEADRANCVWRLKNRTASCTALGQDGRFRWPKCHNG